MNFFDFFVFDMILFFIKAIIILLIYKYFIKRKCDIVSDIATKEIDNYFNAYDNSMDNFVDSINIIDEKESQTPTDTDNSQTPKFF